MNDLKPSNGRAPYQSLEYKVRITLECCRELISTTPTSDHFIVAAIQSVGDWLDDRGELSKVLRDCELVHLVAEEWRELESKIESEWSKGGLAWVRQASQGAKRQAHRMVILASMVALIGDMIRSHGEVNDAAN